MVERMMHTRAGKETLQQILAVDDPNSFNKMMSQRNRELELEAIRALETLSSSAKAAAHRCCHTLPKPPSSASVITAVPHHSTAPHLPPNTTRCSCARWAASTPG